ncbi:MAG: hypothetical protein LUD27_02930 [Clostridia bacterium]|nr:hypothetical protein [Clostridia bacterium]
MLNKSVAVVDIRSSEITAVVAERGVNNTFIIKSKFTHTYEGFAEGQLLDIRSFEVAVQSVVQSTISAVNEKIKTFYVSVPGEFSDVINTDNVISFSSMRKVTRSDVKALEDASFPKNDKIWRTIAGGKLFFVLSDKRKVINPIGMLTDSLRGRMCYYRCKQAFIDCVTNAFHPFASVTKINFVPAVHSEAMYLIAPERRDEYAVLFDFGYISSSFSVVCGNGIAFCESFSLGAGHIAFYLTEALDVPYEVATLLLDKVNLNTKEGAVTVVELYHEGKLYKFDANVLKQKVTEGLDLLCSAIDECYANFTEKNLDGKPLYITGECVGTIRGATDHIGNRLVRSLNIAAPNIPYYDKPQFSSLFSLIENALQDKEKSTLFGTLFK